MRSRILVSVAGTILLAGLVSCLLFAGAGALLTVAAEVAAVCASPTQTPSRPSDGPQPYTSSSDPVLPCPTNDIADTAPVATSSVVAPDYATAVAVATAVDAVGRRGRYVAEGNGPTDFDCSGLTSYAWRAAGVHLADYSYTQWAQTRRIGHAALAPGDLVFWFGGDVHHVAIVVGVNGSRVQIAEAANPSAGIRIRDFGNSWDAAHVSGYGRVVRP